ncbi:hypothetical protein CAPTEDRAFT_201741 [Capitella teleta]|uniref:GATOR2 complex protein WDR24 n=1 Tax=Capitella teleta TaxID=283909 RepID=R7U0Q2_CAPTE|nr:hypothetical protein CAPTEDRAFT_201741 [Capitella teleta]|eukprot:ELT99584.1 hypothetical protein CAPTEDRAFT_201741 [Capitella teleta]
MHHTILEGPLNCLALNRDCSQVVVAGRNVFKIFSIEDQEFQEKVNLRVGRNINLNYSASDVAWNPIQDHLLASAATNGAVVVWDLNRVSRSKQEHVFNNVHKRFVNKVVFHVHESDMLLSGSQDGYMKLFDLRKADVSSSFHGRDGVKDIQYNPSHYFTFAAALENGNIQIWDMRNTSRWERQFTAHNGPVFSLDWHTDEKMWIATAGRDRMIKQQNRVRNTHTVQTIASVAKIKWRPQRKFHISSCSLLLDFSVNVWDIRRPYVPFASFNEHKDCVTGISWKQNNPHVFFSSSKDSTLYQHMFRDATRPANDANPVGISISVHGSVAYASSDKLNSSTTPRSNSYSRLPAVWKRTPERSEQFMMVTSLLNEFEIINSAEAVEDFCMSWFIRSAREYKLSGRSMAEVCEHNAKLADSMKRHQIAQTWRMLKLLYCGKSKKAPPSPVATAINNPKTEVTKDTDAERTEKQEVKKEEKPDTSTVGHGIKNHSDFFFGDGDVDQAVYEYDSHRNMQDGQEWSLPSEAFQPRHEIKETSQPLDPLSENTKGESPSSVNESELNSKRNEQVALSAQSGIKQEILLTPPFNSHLSPWHFTTLVRDMLQSYAEKGDVQTAVTAIIVLGDRIKPHLDELHIEQWFMSYIDLLGRFEMWTRATEIIRMSGHPAVGALNQLSTTIHTHCSQCSKPLLRSGWLCDRCNGQLNVCSVCHLPVRGLYAWCQGCSHGGHLHHIRDWLKTYQHCPTGCGHLCEYT